MSTATVNNDNRLLFYFIIIWFAINALQATFTGLDGDEAYYWMFSRDLQWGYFDHPPMVALSIKIGELLGHGSFFTRLGTIFFSCGAMYFTYQALPDHLRNLKFYLFGFASIVLLNIYGFIVTPDASLFFFTALFFYAYRLFIEKESFPRILLLSLSILGLLYSKYHGILPVFFTFLSNPKLILKSTVWLLIILVIIGFLQDSSRLLTDRNESRRYKYIGLENTLIERSGFPYSYPVAIITVLLFSVDSTSEILY